MGVGEPISKVVSCRLDAKSHKSYIQKSGWAQISLSPKTFCGESPLRNLRIVLAVGNRKCRKQDYPFFRSLPTTICWGNRPKRDAITTARSIIYGKVRGGSCCRPRLWAPGAPCGREHLPGLTHSSCNSPAGNQFLFVVCSVSFEEIQGRENKTNVPMFLRPRHVSTGVGSTATFEDGKPTTLASIDEEVGGWPPPTADKRQQRVSRRVRLRRHQALNLKLHVRGITRSRRAVILAGCGVCTLLSVCTALLFLLVRAIAMHRIATASGAGTATNDESFTVLVNTFERPRQLEQAVRHYAKCHGCVLRYMSFAATTIQQYGDVSLLVCA